MDFNHFQKLASRTAKWHFDLNPRAYTALGLTAEAGEVSNEVKKLFRDDDGLLTSERCAAIVDELGDVLWYAAMLAQEIGVSLDYVAQMNIIKLEKRYNLKDE